METEIIIEMASEKLAAAVAEAAAQVGRDVTMALLIHYLHEVSLQREAHEGAA